MDDGFAPLCTTRERFVLPLKTLAIAIPLPAASGFWLLPWLEACASDANCRVNGGYNDARLVTHGVFVLIPLSSGLLIAVSLLPRAIRVLHVGQDPLPGGKALRETRHRYGFAAVLHGHLVFAIILFSSAWPPGAANGRQI